MNFELIGNEIFPLVEVKLKKDESIMMERGSMVYYNSAIELKAERNANGASGVGGMFKAMGRSMTSGESYYISKATSNSDNGKIALAPSLPGKVMELDITQEQWRLNTGVYLASAQTVGYNMKKQKVSKALFAGTGGLFVMETHGTGSLLINSYGDVVEIELDGKEPMTIDNEHVVAWTSQLDYNIKVSSGMFGFKTGEGLVNEFHGVGKVLIQTRNVHSLAEQLASFSPST